LQKVVRVHVYRGVVGYRSKYSGVVNIREGYRSKYSGLVNVAEDYRSEYS
jgi:hypothetical protein